jgi:hypothetical protein
MFHGVPAIAGGSDDAPSNGHGNGGAASRPLRDLHGIEYAIVVPLVILVLFLGLYPKPVLSRIEPATARTVNCVRPPIVAGIPYDAGPDCAGTRSGTFAP